MFYYTSYVKKWKTPGHATRFIYLDIDWNHHLDQIFSVEWDLTEISQAIEHQITQKCSIVLKAYSSTTESLPLILIWIESILLNGLIMNSF